MKGLCPDCNTMHLASDKCPADDPYEHAIALAKLMGYGDGEGEKFGTTLAYCYGKRMADDALRTGMFTMKDRQKEPIVDAQMAAFFSGVIFHMVYAMVASAPDKKFVEDVLGSVIDNAYDAGIRDDVTGDNPPRDDTFH